MAYMLLISVMREKEDREMLFRSSAFSRMSLVPEPDSRSRRGSERRSCMRDGCACNDGVSDGVPAKTWEAEQTATKSSVLNTRNANSSRGK